MTDLPIDRDAEADNSGPPRRELPNLSRLEQLDQQIAELVTQRFSEIRQTNDEVAWHTVLRDFHPVSTAPQQQGPSGPDVEDLTAVLRHIHSICVRSLHLSSIAFLGPHFSYSHLAAIKYFGAAANFDPVSTIPAVFEAVIRDTNCLGIVPIHNSTDGRVVDTLSALITTDIRIVGEVDLPIHHNLLSATRRDEIVEVHSKPQALSQCRRWLASHLPKAKLVENTSTAEAAQLASRQQGVAAVASIEAGLQYDLRVIAANIEDNQQNVTRFAVLGHRRPDRTGADKTSLLFQVNHQPGALADVMTVFKSQRLNLLWIESFPLPGKPNEYLFFVEMDGHENDKSVSKAIKLLGKQTQQLRILGSYPKA